VTTDNKTLVVKRLSEERRDRSYHGLVRTLLANMVIGVSTGFEKVLEISGVGYRAETKNDTVKLLLGYSSPVEYNVPQGITVRVDKQVNSWLRESTRNWWEGWPRRYGFEETRALQG